MAGWGPEFANWPLWRVDTSSMMTITSENAWKIKLCKKIPPTWAPEGREGRSQAGPKGRKLEVGPRRGPRLLVFIYFTKDIFKKITNYCLDPQQPHFRWRLLQCPWHHWCNPRNLNLGTHDKTFNLYIFTSPEVGLVFYVTRCSEIQ